MQGPHDRVRSLPLRQEFDRVTAKRMTSPPAAPRNTLMRRTALILFAAALAAGSLAAETETETEADPEHTCYNAETEQLEYPEQQVFFHEGDSKIGNAAESPHPWDTTEPTSVATGAGAGQLSLSSQADSSETTTVFEGTFTGCIDTLLFDLYSFDPANRSSTAADAEPNDHTLTLSITVDGLDVYSNGEAQTVTTYANAAMGPNLNRFSVRLGDALAQFESFLPVPLDGEHTVTVRVAPYFINTGVAAIYAWDTSETPSGITFNGEITEEYPSLN